MRYVAGVDVGTGLTKAVVVGRHGGPGSPEPPVVVGRAIERTGARLEAAARAAYAAALDEARLAVSDVEYVASTGFGRYSVPFRDVQITEMTSGARGATYFVPAARFVLDIGSQSTRAVAVVGGGRVGRFKTNDKCAAGSGSFLVRAAKYLQIDVEQAGDLALGSTSPQPISSVCAVLAESEIINHVSAGVAVEDILRGIYDSLADRAALLLKRTGFSDELTFIGGMARQRGMVRALEDRLEIPVVVPPDCEYVCAIGAALLGFRRLDAARDAATVEHHAEVG